MAQLTIGGVTFELGGAIEEKARELGGVAREIALRVVVNSAREWLRLAGPVLGWQHATVLAVHDLVADYDRQHPNG